MKRLLIISLLTLALTACPSSTPKHEPTYRAGEWIRSKAGKKCGIIHAITNFHFRNPPIEYEIRIPDEKMYSGFFTNFISEEEAERCAPPVL